LHREAGIVHWECCQWQHNVALSGSISLQPHKCSFVLKRAKREKART
jgi:hypothetical protein